MKNKIQKEYLMSTSDLYLAAFFLAHKIRLESIDRKIPDRVFFNFKHPEVMDGLADSYFFGTASIEPKSFVAGIKELKQLLYNVPKK